MNEKKTTPPEQPSPEGGTLATQRQQPPPASAPATREDQIVSRISQPNMIREIKRALPRSGCTPDRFLRCVMTSIRKTPKLAECSWKSLIGSMIELAQLGLEPGTPLGHAWLVPFAGEVQIIIGYKGMINLAERGSHISMNATPVYEGDDFEYSLGSNPFIRHRPCEDLSKRGALKYAYSVANFPDGRPSHFKLVNRADIDLAKSNSAGWQSEMRKVRGRKDYKPSGPWFDNEPAMWMKTAIRRHAPFLSLGVEFARAIELDEQYDSGTQIFDVTGVDLSALPEPSPSMRATEIGNGIDEVKRVLTQDKFEESAPTVDEGDK